MDIYTKLNYTPFSNSDLKEIAESYFRECKNASIGTSSLPFYNSLIQYDFSEESSFQRVLVIDIGGSHLRLAWMESGDLYALHDIKVYDVEKFDAGIKEFISFVDDHISEYLRVVDIECQAVGIAFSFGFTPVNNNGDIDISREGKESDNWGKGYVVQNSKTNISKLLKEHLRDTKDLEFGRWMGVNDVVALHLNSRECLASVIVGTGYNISVIGDKKLLISTEGKRFACENTTFNIPVPIVELLNDMENIDMRLYEAQRTATNEMQIAAYYMPDIFLKSLEILEIQDDRIVKSVNKLKAEIISLFFAFDIDIVRKRLGYKVDEVSFQTYKKISTAIINRSASLVAAELVGAMQFSRGNFATDKSIIIADGAIFQKTQGYRELVQSYMNQITGDSSVVIKCVSDSGLRGAGVSVFTKSV